MIGYFRKYRDSLVDFLFYLVIDCLMMKFDENEMLCFFFDLMRFRYGVYEIFVFYFLFEGLLLISNDVLLFEYLLFGYLVVFVCVGKYCFFFMFLCLYFKMYLWILVSIMCF